MVPAQGYEHGMQENLLKVLCLVQVCVVRVVQTQFKQILYTHEALVVYDQQWLEDGSPKYPQNEQSHTCYARTGITHITYFQVFLAVASAFAIKEDFDAGLKKEHEHDFPRSNVGGFSTALAAALCWF